MQHSDDNAGPPAQAHPQGPLFRALGLMSGTSMDGIDVAEIETDGRDRIRRGTSRTYPYDQGFRHQLAEAIALARDVADRAARPGRLREIEAAITERHADAVVRFLAETNRDPAHIDLIGFHGQTVLHRPDLKLTLQLGDGAALARAVAIPVAWDMRANDVVAGGQGAPLAPAYHRAMAGAAGTKPIAILNIGGVANVTWIGADGEMIAFDTGPGNALLDDWMAKTVGVTRDEGGAAALAGRSHEDVVAFFLNHAYFAARPPKSLDRNAFFWDLVTGLSVEDGAATLVAMTVGSVRRALDHLPVPPVRWIVTGGGRHNAATMLGLAAALGVPVDPAEAIGFDGDAVEAEAWAYLAVRCKLGLPLSYPGTTGVPEPTLGGRIDRP
ncbi:MAG: anhydro-N-acetylmuramic acid kinase [Hyphomicrobiaceae bacterium]